MNLQSYDQPRPALYRIKSGKLQVWREWCVNLSTSLRSIAEETAGMEGALIESFIIFSINEEWYTLGLVITRDGCEPEPADSSLEINKRHKIVKRECLEPLGWAEYGYILSGLSGHESGE